MPFGIDIASHQGAGFDVARAVSEGYEFVFVKATEGTTYRNPYFIRHGRAARLAGALPGAYHYLRAGDGAAQAYSFVQYVNEAFGSTRGVLLACDNETDASWSTTQAFFQRVWELTGAHHVIMYTGGWWWRPRGWAGSSLAGALWDSHYVTGTGFGSELYAKVPDSWWSPGYGGWAESTILQFSSKGMVAGQLVDVNYVKDMARLRQLAMLDPDSGSTPDQGGIPVASGDADFAASHVPAPGSGGDTGMHVAVGDVWARVIEVQGQLANLGAAIGQLQASLDVLSTGGVDLNALAGRIAAMTASTEAIAAAVADQVAERMKS